MSPDPSSVCLFSINTADGGEDSSCSGDDAEGGGERGGGNGGGSDGDWRTVVFTLGFPDGIKR